MAKKKRKVQVHSPETKAEAREQFKKLGGADSVSLGDFCDAYYPDVPKGTVWGWIYPEKIKGYSEAAKQLRLKEKAKAERAAKREAARLEDVDEILEEKKALIEYRARKEAADIVAAEQRKLHLSRFNIEERNDVPLRTYSQAQALPSIGRTEYLPMGKYEVLSRTVVAGETFIMCREV